MNSFLKVDTLVAEIGSTTSVVSAFHNEDDDASFIGQGLYPTTVNDGDVTIGLNKAIENLLYNLGYDSIDYNRMLATSSAAGGLKMCVHGLVYDMTVKAAEEAALGAGANIHMVTTGKLRRTDLRALKEINPNIILIAGGVDYGERDTAIYNAEKIAELGLSVPVIYAGNRENQDEIKLIFSEQNKSNYLYITENVYPRIDELQVEPVRNVIQKVFEEHIIKAPGMEKLKELINGPIIPTPGAAMEASKLLKNDIGDLMTFDVGGATTDVHSVTDGSPEVNKILLAPEPTAKRTVEGDLGVFINQKNILGFIETEKLLKELNFDKTTLENIVNNYHAVPKNKNETAFVERLTKEAVFISIQRHAGRFKKYFGGETQTMASGKDLTAVKWIIGTGGALTKLTNGRNILQKIPHQAKGVKLYPPKKVEVLIDNYYIMSAMGVMSKIFPQNALKLMKKSLGIEKIK